MNNERRHCCPVVVGIFCICVLSFEKGEIKQKKKASKEEEGKEGEVLLLSSLMVSFGCCCYPEGVRGQQGF